MPKMCSLYSDASIFPRRPSQARKSRPDSWLRVSLVISPAKSNQFTQVGQRECRLLHHERNRQLDSALNQVLPRSAWYELNNRP